MIKIGIYVKSDKNRYKDSETKIKKVLYISNDF